MMSANTTPVLFVIYNRPDKTERVFEAIRQAKPYYLFIAADGPRLSDENDIEKCRLTREIVDKADWECEVKTLFRPQNLGCKIAVSQAISWFFEHVTEGVILEDDCLPNASFFQFCTEMLTRYRNDNAVMSVSGSNLSGRPWKCESQSYFGGHGGIWGWATWRRAWAQYDMEMKNWNVPGTQKKIRRAMGNGPWFRFYHGLFESTFLNKLDTWDMQWFYTILINNGIAINPCVNLVENIGFGDGTHTHTANHWIATMKHQAMTFPLKHPEKMVLDRDFLKVLYKSVINDEPGKIETILRLLRRIKRKYKSGK